MQPRSAHPRAAADRLTVDAAGFRVTDGPVPEAAARRPAAGAASLASSAAAADGASAARSAPVIEERAVRAAVVIVSDRSARGERADAVGPGLVERLRGAGYAVGGVRIVADGVESVEAALRAEIAAGARLVLTSGGTGVGPRDRTPEGTRAVLARELPGIAEALRQDGAAHVPTAVLSRGLAGVADQPGTGGALVVNLPGSPGGARDGADLVLGIARHAIAQFDGGDHVPGGRDAHAQDHADHADHARQARLPDDAQGRDHPHGRDHAQRGRELDRSEAPR